jgi:hypothetical protein
MNYNNADKIRRISTDNSSDSELSDDNDTFSQDDIEQYNEFSVEPLIKSFISNESYEIQRLEINFQHALVEFRSDIF